jgi:hypothetical protein
MSAGISQSKYQRLCSVCEVIDFSLERDEDRKTRGVFILTIYDDIKKPSQYQDYKSIVPDFVVVEHKYHKGSLILRVHYKIGHYRLVVDPFK